MTDITEKFYTPSISEFHVGFEYQWQDAQYPEHGWAKAVIKEGYQINDIHGMRFEDLPKYNLRVKHLDHEDIIECGWKPSKLLLAINSHEMWFKNKLYHIYSLHADFYGENVYAIRIKDNNDWFKLFCGTIPNKSVLKQVMKMIGVTA